MMGVVVPPAEVMAGSAEGSSTVIALATGSLNASLMS